MPTLTGSGLFVLKGIHGSIDSYVGGGVTVNANNSKLASVAYQQTSNVSVFRDTLGNAYSAVGQKVPDEVLSIDFTVHSQSSAGSLALAKSNVRLPDTLAVVALTGFGNTSIDGNWNYLGDGTINYTEGFVTLSMPIGRWNGASLGTPTDFSV